MDDERIIQELKKGNTYVLKYCYKKSFNQVERMITQRGGSIEDARDTFHDALIVLNSKCRTGDFELTSSLSTYLFSVCKYSWMNIVGKKKKTVELVKEIENEEIEAVDQSKDQLVEQIIGSLSRLGEKCKEIIMDYYFGRFSYDEIATHLGYSSGQVVRQQKYRCMQRLKEQTAYVHE